MSGSLTTRIGRMVRGPSGREEQPRDERYYIRKAAKVQLPSGDVVEVLVRNISANGASLEFRGLVLPEKVLIIEHSLKLHRWAKVVWQKPGGAGLAFVADESLHAPANDDEPPRPRPQLRLRKVR